MARFNTPILTLAAVVLLGCGSSSKQVDRGPAYQSCKSGNVESCWSYAESRGSTPQERRDALVAHQFACHLEHAPSCRKLGEIMGEEDEGLRSYEASAQACEAGELRACVAIVDSMSRERARTTLKTACEQDIGQGCYELARLVDDEWRVSRGRDSGFSLYEKACSLDVAEACVAAGQALVFGSGVEADPDRGIELLERGCEAEVRSGCTILARIFEDGMGVEADAARASRYQQQAEGEVVRDALFASTFILQADGCARSHPLACYNAAEMRRAGEEIEQNFTIARDLFRAACRDEVRSACTRVDEFDVVEKP